MRYKIFLYIFLVLFFVLLVSFSTKAAPVSSATSESQVNQLAALSSQLEFLKKLLLMASNSLFSGYAQVSSSSCSSSLITLLGDGCHYMYSDSSGNAVYCDGPMSKSAKSGDTTTTTGCSSSTGGSTTTTTCSPETCYSATYCFDGIDNDNDGFIDSADPGCGGSGTTSTTGSPETYYSATYCSDGIDNDLDGFTDAADPACGGSGSQTACNNNGTCDYGESSGSCPADCGGSTCSPETCYNSVYCADGVDNDNDGFTDSADPGCGGSGGTTSSCSSALITLLGTGCHYMFTNSSGSPVYCDGPMTKSAKSGDTTTATGCSSPSTGGGGSPSTCNAITSQSTCQGTSGCQWNSPLGFAAYCSMIYAGDASSCPGFSYSTWDSTSKRYCQLNNYVSCQYNYPSYLDISTYTATNCPSTTGGGGSTTPGAPATPTNLSARVEGGNVILQWTDSSTNEDEYRIWSKGSGGSWGLLVTVGIVYGGAGTYNHVGGVSGNEYLIKACSYANGCSQDSNTAIAGSTGGGTSTCGANTTSSACLGSSSCYWFSGVGYGYCDSAPSTVYAGNSTSCPGFSSSRWDSSNQRYCQLNGARACQYGYPDYIDPAKYSQASCPASSTGFCGDGVCQSGESYSTCSNDCPLPKTPVISNIALSNTTSDSVTITWLTDRPTNSKIEYWINTVTGDFKYDSAYVVNHSLALSGLKASTTYTYNIVSQDTFYYTGYAYGKKFTTLPGVATAQCSDGRDNDGDGLIDYPADTGCYGPEDQDEYYTSTTVGSAICDSGLITLLGTGCHQMYTDSFGNPIFCDNYMTKSAKRGDTVATSGCSYSGGGSYQPPAGQKEQTWNSLGLRSWIRTDADSARIEQLKTSCASAPLSSNVWLPESGNSSSKDFGMPDSTKCQKAAACASGQYFDGATCVSGGTYTGSGGGQTCDSSLTTLLGTGCHYMYNDSSGNPVYCDGPMSKSAKRGDTVTTSGCSSPGGTGGGGWSACNAYSTQSSCGGASGCYWYTGNGYAYCDSAPTTGYQGDLNSCPQFSYSRWDGTNKRYCQLNQARSCQYSYPDYKDPLKYSPTSCPAQDFTGTATTTTTTSSQCPAGYHYMGSYWSSSGSSSGAYCMSDNDYALCQPLNGGATYTCPGSTTPIATSTTVGDINPPYVDYSQSYPKSGDSNVSVNTKVTVKFNEEVDRSSFGTNQFFSLSEGGYVSTAAGSAVSLAGTFSIFTDGFDFIPASPLKAGTFYTWRVFPGIKDRAGNSASQESSASFTTTVNTIAGTGSIAGQVTDGSGNPVVGAIVGLANSAYSFWKNTETASAGMYKFGEIPAGSYRLSLYSPSNKTSLIIPVDVTVSVEKGKETKQDLAFVVSAKVVKGTVKTSAGTAVGDARVSIYRQDGPGWAETETNASGVYTLSVSGGIWQMNIYPRDYAKATWVYNESPIGVAFAFDSKAETKTVDFKVSLQNSKIAGKFAKADGSAPKPYEVSLNLTAAGRSYPAYLSGDGSFSVAVSAGTYDVYVWSSDPSLKAPPLTITVGENETKDIGTIRLSKPLEKIAGKVSDESGKPVGGVSVTAYQSGKGGNYSYSKTDASGNYEISVSAGFWNVSVSGDPSGNVTSIDPPTEVEVKTGATTSYNIRVSLRDATIQGLIKDLAGNVVDDFYGYVYVEGTDRYGGGLGAPVDKGTFTLRVPGGTHKIILSITSSSGWTSQGAVIVTVVKGGAAKISIAVKKNSSAITGSVTDSQGKVITGVPLRISASGEDGAWQDTSVDSLSGKFTLKLSAGTWFLKASSYGGGYGSGGGGYSWKGEEVKVEVPEGRTVTQNLTLQSSNATIKGVVLKPDGSPMSNVWVSVDSQSTGSFADIFLGAVSFRTLSFSVGSQTDGSGKFSVTVPAGTYFVHVYLPSQKGLINPEEQKVTVEEGKTSEITLSFSSPDAFIRGTVLLESNPASAFVAAWSEKGGYIETKSDSEGKYSLRVNRSDVWHVYARKENEGISYKSSEASVKVSEGTETSQDLVLLADRILPKPVTASVAADKPSSVTTEDGARVAVPANSVSSSGGATISVSPDAELPKQGNKDVVGIGYDVKVFDDKGQAVSKLNTAVTVSIPYDPEELKKKGLTPRDLKIGFWDEKAGAWKELPASIVNEEDHTVSAIVDHLTRFAIVAAADIVPPSAPTEVAGVALGDGKIKLSWINPSKDFSHAKLYRSDQKGVLGEVRVAEVFGSAFTDEGGINDGVFYQYVVRSVDPAGNESGNKDQVSVLARGTSASKKLVLSFGKKETGAQLVQKKSASVAAQAALSVSVPPGALYRSLSSGSAGDDVKILQKFLADNGFYPEGIVSGTFGPLTSQAVTRFQEKYASEILAPAGLLKGNGFVGPGTRKKINELLDFTPSSNQTPPPGPAKESPLPPGQATKLEILSNLSQGTSGEEVKVLQEILLKEGVYPDGLITGFFGGLTKQAVIRFQEKYAEEVLTPAGMDKGSGFVGPLTRKKLKELSLR